MGYSDRLDVIGKADFDRLISRTDVRIEMIDETERQLWGRLPVCPSSKRVFPVSKPSCVV